jgi:hypothetical protein
VFGGAAGISACSGAFCSGALGCEAPLCGSGAGPPQLATNMAETKAIRADLFMSPSIVIYLTEIDFISMADLMKDVFDVFLIT